MGVSAVATRRAESAIGEHLTGRSLTSTRRGGRAADPIVSAPNSTTERPLRMTGSNSVEAAPNGISECRCSATGPSKWRLMASAEPRSSRVVGRSLVVDD